MKTVEEKIKIEPQTQSKPGLEKEMRPSPIMTGQVLHPNGGEIINT